MPYQYDENKQNNSQWDEYLDSLDEDGYPRQEEKVTLSPQVEEDLMRFKKTSVLHSSKKPLLIVGIILFLVTMITAGFIAFRASMNNNIYIDEGPQMDPIEIEEQYIFLDEAENVKKPVFQGEDNTVYELPMKVSDFLRDDWTILPLTGNDPIPTVGSEAKQFKIVKTYGDVGVVTVVSPTGEEVPVADSTIIGFTYEKIASEWFSFPGIYLYLGEEPVLDTLNEAGIDYEVIDYTEYDGKIIRFETTYENESEYQNYTVNYLIYEGEVYQIDMQLSK